MIKSLSLKNYGPVEDLNVDNLGKINLLIGPNRSGKTLVLKVLYCAQRTIELTGRGKNPQSDKEILASKLYWTFQVDKLGQLVRKPNNGSLQFAMRETDGDEFEYSFGADTERKIVKLEGNPKNRTSNSVFIPAKEVLSLLSIIRASHDVRMECLKIPS